MTQAAESSPGGAGFILFMVVPESVVRASVSMGTCYFSVVPEK